MFITQWFGRTLRSNRNILGNLIDPLDFWDQISCANHLLVQIIDDDIKKTVLPVVTYHNFWRIYQKNYLSSNWNTELEIAVAIYETMAAIYSEVGKFEELGYEIDNLWLQKLIALDEHFSTRIYPRLVWSDQQLLGSIYLPVLKSISRLQAENCSKDDRLDPVSDLIENQKKKDFYEL